MKSFAQKELEKYGWNKGEGLGKNSDGISRALSISVKDDTNGLGANANEWSTEWWDHCFNKTTANICIESTAEGILVKKAEKVDSVIREKTLLYGSFVKSGDSQCGKDEEEKDYSIKVSDADLLAACEGRTARKGARVDQIGKLKRVVLNHDPSKVKKREKKDQKEKKRDKKKKRKRD